MGEQATFRSSHSIVILVIKFLPLLLLLNQRHQHPLDRNIMLRSVGFRDVTNLPHPDDLIAFSILEIAFANEMDVPNVPKAQLVSALRTVVVVVVLTLVATRVRETNTFVPLMVVANAVRCPVVPNQQSVAPTFVPVTVGVDVVLSKDVTRVHSLPQSFVLNMVGVKNVCIRSVKRLLGEERLFVPRMEAAFVVN